MAGMVGVVVLNYAVVKKLMYKNKNSSYPCSFIRVFKKYVIEMSDWREKENVDVDVDVDVDDI